MSWKPLSPELAIEKDAKPISSAPRSWWLPPIASGGSSPQGLVLAFVSIVPMPAVRDQPVDDIVVADEMESEAPAVWSVLSDAKYT